MTWFECSDEDCGHRWFEASALDLSPDCVQCGEAAGEFDPDELEFLESTTTPVVTRKPQIAKARSIANKQIDDHDIVHGYRVDVEALATALGLTIKPRPTLGELRGRLVGDRIEIVSSDHPVVQRFSIAHEIGHFLLGHKHGDGSWAETEANNFANELLVPGDLLARALKETTSKAELRKEFEVSRPVLDIAAKHHHLANRLVD